jgi:hypothetical protein
VRPFHANTPVTALHTCRPPAFAPRRKSPNACGSRSARQAFADSG